MANKHADFRRRVIIIIIMYNINNFIRSEGRENGKATICFPLTHGQARFAHNATYSLVNDVRARNVVSEQDIFARTMSLDERHAKRHANARIHIPHA